MANAKFDSKSFNPEAFRYLVDRVPNLTLNELKKSRALAGNADIKAAFTSQNGTAYARLAMRGLADGAAVNYDGGTDIPSTMTKTYEQGVVVVGRAKGWTEKDFSYDITGGVDFMDNVSQQVAEYKDKLDQDTILATLDGIFAMTGGKSADFVAKHTYVEADKMTATTLNTAITQACGDNKKKFSLVFMHSAIATGLENLNALEYLKYTDSQGVQRDLSLATWNGKLVVIDDSMPTEQTITTAGVYTLTISTAAVAGDKITLFGTEYEFVANDTEPTAYQIKVGASGTAANQATNIKTLLESKVDGPETAYTYSASSGVLTMTLKTSVTSFVEPSASVPGEDTIKIALATTTEPVTTVKYVTYALGDGAIAYEDIGAKVPYEMDRDPARNGGEDTLYIRQRKVFSPYGISYEKVNQASLSPTNTELRDGANWCLVHTGEATESSRTYINHRAIPIAKIVSNG